MFRFSSFFYILSQNKTVSLSSVGVKQNKEITLHLVVLNKPRGNKEEHLDIRGKYTIKRSLSKKN